MSCDWNQKDDPVTINTTVTDKTNICTNEPSIDMFTVLDIEWVNVKDSNDINYPSLTPKHYQNLSLNIHYMIKNIKDKNNVIEYYRRCTKD